MAAPTSSYKAADFVPTWSAKIWIMSSGQTRKKILEAFLDPLKLFRKVKERVETLKNERIWALQNK